MYTVSSSILPQRRFLPVENGPVVSAEASKLRLHHWMMVQMFHYFYLMQMTQVSVTTCQIH